MNPLYNKAFFFLFAFLVSTSAVIAQQTDFSGTWVLKNLQGVSGVLYSNSIPFQMKVNQNKQVIIIEKYNTELRSDKPIVETLRSNGKPFETVTASKRKKHVTIKWYRVKKRFTTISTFFNSINQKLIDKKITDLWSIKGGILVMERKSENFLNGEVFESRGVYARE